MKFWKVLIPAKQFEKVSDTHKQFVFASSMAIQEINLALRLYSMALATQREAQQTGSYSLMTMAHSNMSMLERNAMSKISEYREILNVYLKVTPQQTESLKLTAFRELVNITLKAWEKNKLFGRMKWYRNNASAHYGFDANKKGLKADGLGLFTKDIGSSQDDRVFEILMHQTVGNTHYTMVEQLLMEKLGEEGKDPLIEAEANWKTIQEVGNTVTTLHYAYLEAFMEMVDVQPGEAEVIDVPHRLTWNDKTKIPILLQEPGSYPHGSL